MANYSRWEDIKNREGTPSAETRAAVEQDLDLGQLIYDLRTEAGLSQRELAERMGTTQSVISRLEEGGGARNRIDTLARVARALDRHLVLSFPSEVPDKLTDAVQVAGGGPGKAHRRLTEQRETVGSSGEHRAAQHGVDQRFRVFRLVVEGGPACS